MVDVIDGDVVVDILVVVDKAAVELNDVLVDGLVEADNEKE